MFHNSYEFSQESGVGDARVANPRFLGEPWFWLRTSLLIGTIVLHLTLSGLILLCIAGTVYYKACNTLGIKELAPDASLTDWGQVYVVF
jgi:hypothetical protein